MPRNRRPSTVVAILLLGAVALVMAGPPAASAQSVVGLASLRQLTRDADAVVLARITTAGAELDAGGRTYPIVHAEVRSTLKGSAAPGAIAFANVGPHGTTLAPTLGQNAADAAFAVAPPSVATP